MNKQREIHPRQKLVMLLALLLVIAGGGVFLFTQPGKQATMEPVMASSVVATGDFRLTAGNKWDAASKRNYAELNWDSIANLSQSGYQLYQSEDGTTWNNRSLNYGKAIKVLNVYPDVAGSNQLQSWMNGLGLTDSNGNNLIQVTPVAIASYNTAPDSYLKDAAGNYQYDVIMFGTWDWNGSRDLSAASAAATQNFVNSGRGVLFGHDTVTGSAYNDGVTKHTNFNTFAGQLGIVLDLQSVYRVGSTTVEITNNGYMMKYPFELENNLSLTVPLTHSWGQGVPASSTATKWLQFTAPFSFNVDNGTADPNFYLVTNNNLGLIQTGHSNATSTEDERKIIANALYNLAQVSLDTSANDQTVKDDQAPDAPIYSIRCGIQGQLNIKVDAKDNGKDYLWYVDANTKDQGVLTSDIVSETIISNVAGYFYEVTDSPASSLQTTVEGYKDAYGRIDESLFDVYVAPSTDALAYDTESTFTISEKTSSGKYLHVVAVDRASNVSVVSSEALNDVLQYVDFEVERTGDEAKLVELQLDASLDGTKKSLEVQIPTNAVIKDFNSLVLPSGWYSFENSETADYKSFTFAMETTNDAATIQTFLESLRFTITSPVNQEGAIRLVFHEKVYTSYEHPDGTTHYYTFIKEDTDWFNAYNQAKKTTYKQLTGYLTTITSSAEHSFVFDNIAKEPGWLGGTRMVQSSDTSKLNDAAQISTDANSYSIAESQWYWANGPEAGSIFYNGITHSGGTTPAGAYSGWSSNEPNNTWIVGAQKEYVLQFAKSGSKNWNDLPGTLPYYAGWNHGYYVEFSEYGDQTEGIEITDVCWAAAVPQKVALKAYDEAGNALPDGDQLYDQALRIDKEETVLPTELWMYEFIKLTNLDDTAHPLAYTISDQFQEGKLIYASRKATVHLRQVVTDKNEQLVMPETGYGQLVSQQSDGTEGQTFSISMVSSENNAVPFSDYVLRYDAGAPIYTYQLTIPEYYQLVGYVVTTTNQQHLPTDSTATATSVDVSQTPEFWVTAYVKQSQEVPQLYSWDYRENEFGTVSVP